MIKFLVAGATIAGVYFATQQFLYYTPKEPKILATTELKKVIQPNAFSIPRFSWIETRRSSNFPLDLKTNPRSYGLLVAPDIGHKAIVLLAYHPQLQALEWPMIEMDHYTLYQRVKVYGTIQDFLDNPPQSSKIIMDYKFSELPQYSGLTENTIGDAISFDDASIDYIFTTFKPSRFADEVQYYETIFDASTAQVNDLDEMIWQIKAPQATEENPFYLGTIHVDYRQ